MSQRVHRRRFIQAGAAAGVGFWVAGGLQAQESKSPNERIRFGCIGVGGQGSSDSGDASNNGDVVAVCDIDEGRLNLAGNRFSGSQKFFDFREMLDKVGENLDAVTVSTPDHTHAVATAQAIKMGLHCYVQKPLTHSIYEARVLTELARKHKVATQMGNQGTAERGLRRAAAIIHSGALGKVSEVHVWTNRPIWTQGVDRPAPAGEVPAGIKWDLFLGPAAERPYARGYHPFSWRGWWDFGTGALGDMACHTLNVPFMALDMRNPTSVEAEHSGHNKDSYPNWSVIKYEFPAAPKRPLFGKADAEPTGEMRPALTLTWYDGGRLPSRDLLDGANPARSGALVIGEKGKLYSPGDYGADFRLLGDVEEPRVEYPASPGHFQELARAIRGGEPPLANFDYSGPLTETVLLGNLAVWAGKRIEWDAENLKATNAPEVEPIVKHEYRKGWTL